MSRTFGEFDPRFLGVSLAVSSASRLDFLTRYALGPETITDSDASTLDDDEFLERVSCLTVLAHEFRHFHDHIISPYGSRTMHARCVLAFDTAMLLVGIYENRDPRSANMLPAPLSTWCRMSQAERDTYIAELDAAAAHRGGRFVAPHLPFLAGDGSVRHEAGVPQPSDEISEAVRGCSQAARALDDLQSVPEDMHPPKGLDASLIWEASAVLVQCQEILNAVGERALDRFTDILVSNPRSRYGTALRTVLAIFGRANLPGDMANMLLFTLWCLLGDPYQEGRYASPIVRCAKLGDLLVQKGARAIGSSAQDTCELWDRLTGSAPTLSSLSDSIGRDQIFYDWLMEKLQEAGLTGEHRIITAEIELLDQFMEARRHLIARLQADPESYASPAGYLNSLGELSAAPIKVVADSGGGIELPVDFDKNGWYVYAGKIMPDTGQRMGMIIGPPVQAAGLPHIDRDTAFDACTHFILSDILFGPDIVDVPQPDWEIASNFLMKREVRLLRINL